MWTRIKYWVAMRQYDAKQGLLGIRKAPAPLLGQLVPAGLLAVTIERLPAETQRLNESLDALRRGGLLFTGTTPAGPSDEGSDEA